MIVAASSNNQAVTNIIDAFEKDFDRGVGPFAGRWLPEVESFGMFLASNSRRLEAARRYQTEEFQVERETVALCRARQESLSSGGGGRISRIRQPRRGIRGGGAAEADGG
ncbi:hypothetical protein [Rhizobium sp. 57MFTsu3.2]|uniref:hypothetical protein n=1 Tax=Rhizobium sp. 57MFTsu3.2 TaxID=1048681 RepID=UPI00146F8250|nr:hypothetical protein [Rhizobium sp. 57MFTsu3.2]